MEVTEKSKKRELIKSIAIVFLVVLLILTFFSGTIMNYSLPEVATSYVQSGTITAKIRGTGTVESGDPYEVKVTESRKVASVAVVQGQTVQKGDVLLYLEDAESDELKAAREALETAQNEYELALLKAEITSSNIYSANEDVSSDVYRQQITNAQGAVKKAENELKAAKDALEAAKGAVTPYEQKVAEIDELIGAYQNQIAHDSNQDVITRSQQNVANTKAAYDAAYSAWEKANDELVAASVSGGDLAPYQSKVTIAEAEKNNKYNEWQKALKSENDRAAAVNNLSAGKADLELQKSIVEREKLTAENAVKEKEAAVTAAEAVVTEKTENLNELVGSIGNVMGLEQMLDKIAKAQATVDELTAKSTNATVNADIAGTVTQINVKAGNKTDAATPVMVLQPEGAGYTLSFSVTNEQAKRLSVGDRADLVNAWRYDDVEVTLASIKPDKQDPGQKKLLTFNVTGEVTAGQTFNISVGQKSANYDLTVPNSAIREDSNGKFILIVESKSSPLGNRYIATRVDVEVLASDDTQSAISGALNGYEYVITTSNKPVEAGKQVRMPNN